MRIHIDCWFFCWQFISELQQNLEHVEVVDDVSVHDIATDDDNGTAIMGFTKNGE